MAVIWQRAHRLHLWVLGRVNPGRPRAALAFGTVVWSGACLPFAAMARGTEDGSVLVYGTAGIIAVGFLFVFSTLSALAQSSRLNNARRSIVNDSIHHVAITVDDIPRAIAWYKEHFTFDIAWQDDSGHSSHSKTRPLRWSNPSQHPPHIAFVKDRLSQYGTPVPHGDGTASVYIQDSEGNTVEMLSVPECEAS